ncbi:MAG: VWA domain-containing protein [Terriglobia bacterium]|jgi:VWFA-related protein
MRLALSEKGRTKKAVGKWKVISAVLALTALAVGVCALRAPAQQTTTPAAPTTPAAAGDSAHQGPSAPPPKTSTIRTTVELVTVPVTAINKRGQQVIDLNKDEFQVFEDGVQQPIRSLERETSTPLRVGLILDTSNTARSHLSYEKDAAIEFVFMALRNGGTKNQIFLQTFDATSSIIQDFTNDPDVLNDKIQALKSGGGKALYDAIYFACKEKMLKTGSPEDVRRILIIMSDGLDVQSQHTLDQAVSEARIAETMIYTVGTAAYGYSNPGDKLLEDMSSETGGAPSFPLRDAPGTDLLTGYLSHGQIGETSQNKGLGAETGAFSAQRLVHLADALQDIGRELDEQYTITYKPLRGVLDGTYRSIKVVTTHKGTTLRWKPGYFATAE